MHRRSSLISVNFDDSKVVKTTKKRPSYGQKVVNYDTAVHNYKLKNKKTEPNVDLKLGNRKILKKVRGKVQDSKKVDRMSWLLSKIRSSYKPSSIPVVYKIPIALLAGYMLTLILSLSLIGITLDGEMAAFEDEILRRGIGKGFSEINSLNKSISDLLQQLKTLKAFKDYILPSTTMITDKQQSLINDMNRSRNEFFKYKSLIDSTQFLKFSLNKYPPQVQAQLNTTVKSLITTIQFLVGQYDTHNKTIHSHFLPLLDNVFSPDKSYYFLCVQGKYAPWHYPNWHFILGENGTYFRLIADPKVLATSPSVSAKNPVEILTSMSFCPVKSSTNKIVVSSASLTTNQSEGYLLKMAPSTEILYEPARIDCGLFKKVTT